MRNKDGLVKLIEERQKQQAQQALAEAQARHAMQQAQVAKAGADAEDASAQAADRRAQTLVRMHGMAADHAAMTAPPPVQPPGVPFQHPLGY